MCDSCPCQEQVVNKRQQARSVQDFVSEMSTAKNTETLDQLALFFYSFISLNTLMLISLVAS